MTSLILLGLGIAVFVLFKRFAGLRAQLVDLQRQIDIIASQTLDVPDQKAVSDQQILSAEHSNPEPIVTSSGIAKPAPVTASDRPDKPSTSRTNRNYVFRAENISRLTEWFIENWTLAVAALSLVLGGVFMVQYGIERGLLTPAMRIVGAVVLGIGFLAGGEILRRRYGQGGEHMPRHIPSTLSGAGIVTLFVAALAAHGLYDIIGPIAALIAMAVVSIGAMILGWYYGPLLAAIGIIGGVAAPFLVGGSSDDVSIFYAYFAFIGLLGLGIDSVHRWAWLSVLAIGGATIGIALLWLSAPDTVAMLLSVFLLSFGIFTIPEQSITPYDSGAPFFELRILKYRASFPTYLALSGALIATGAAFWTTLTEYGAVDNAVGFAAFVFLFGVAALWLNRAPALDGIAALPAIGFIAALIIQSATNGALYSGFVNVPEIQEAPAPSTTVWWLLGAAMVMAFWSFARARNHGTELGRYPNHWGLGAAAIATAVPVVLDQFWMAPTVLGSYPWALAMMGCATIMVIFAERTAKAGLANWGLQAGFYSAAAVVLIALALFSVLTKSALTIALAVLVLASAWFARRTDMRPLHWVVQLGVAALTYRMLIDPADWLAQYNMPYSEFYLVYGIVLASYAASLRIGPAKGTGTYAVLESAFLVTAAIFGSAVVIRISSTPAMVTFALMSMMWFASMFAQLWRMRFSTPVGRWFRKTIISISFMLGTIGMVVMLFHFEALLNGRILVDGPPIFDSLLFSFIPLAAVLGFGAYKTLRPVTKWGSVVKFGFYAMSGLLVTLWVWVEIRRLWRGRNLAVGSASDAELYSYTIAMLLASGLVLMLSVWKHSPLLLRAAMTGAALTTAKVFFIDMSGLSGLTRVASFVVLGLVLIGLAWLNRWVKSGWRADDQA